jgi:hypothetical protein
MLAEPTIGVVFDRYVLSHNICPVFQLLKNVVLDFVFLLLALLLGLFFLLLLNVKKLHDLLLAVV